MKLFAIADHVENVLAHDGRLADHADVRRFRGEPPVSFIFTERFTEWIESACRLYLSTSCAFVAVWSLAGACDGFTTVLWLTEQPDATSQAVATSVKEAIGGRVVPWFCAV